MSRPAAAIIIAIKSPDAPVGISRPFVALMGQVATDLGIHLQVEDIEGGLLLFLRDRADFDRVTKAMEDAGARVPDTAWGNGARSWRLTLLKPEQPATRGHILETCKHLLAALLGPRGAAEIAETILTFRVPVGVNLLLAFWRRFEGL